MSGRTSNTGERKGHPKTCLRRHREVQPIRNLALGGDGWSAPRSGRFTSRKDPVNITQEVGWGSEPVWTGAENPVPYGDSIPGPSRPQRVTKPTELSLQPGEIKMHIQFYISVSVYHKSIIYNKPKRCNSGSIVFINNYKYALHVSHALCVHLQEHYKL